MTSLADDHSILIVDDNPTNLEVLSEALSEAGFEVAVAIDGQSALEQVSYYPPSLILLDVMMPGMDGIETFERLKRHKFLHSIPVIFLTAKAQSIQRRQLSQIGACGIISKPFNSLQLAGQISKLLGWQLHS